MRRAKSCSVLAEQAPVSRIIAPIHIGALHYDMPSQVGGPADMCGCSRVLLQAFGAHNLTSV